MVVERVICVLFFCSTCFGASLNFGPFEMGRCPLVRTLATLDMSRYLGRWEEVVKFPFAPSPFVGSGYGPDADCVTCWYDNENTGSVYRVTNTGVFKETGRMFVATGSLLPEAEGLRLHLVGNGLLTEEYMVLDTDYTSFASVWNCREFPMMGGIFRREFGWILGRGGYLPRETYARAELAFTKFGIKTEKLKQSDRTGCIRK